VVDPRVEDVLAILPDYEPGYVEALLQRAEYGSVERVVEALLEGTAPPPEAIRQQRQLLQQPATSKAQNAPARDEFEYTRDRRNVFDGEEMDVSKLRIGKKRFFIPFPFLVYPLCVITLLLDNSSDDAMTILRDRSFVEQMKTDILRRVEASSDSEDEEVNIFGGVAGKGRMREVAFDDELEDVGAVRVAGDGEESSVNEDEDEDERGEEEPEMTPQMIVELAYVSNPKVFERDAATRRSKERAALRAQTGASQRRPSRSTAT
jgi:activating signal cointegrator complex subunit 2